MGKLRERIIVGPEAARALQVIVDRIHREVIRRAVDSVYKRDSDTIMEADILESASECGLKDWMQDD
jgi:histone H3/H4